MNGRSLRCVLHTIQPGSVCFDIGANVGQASLLLAEATGKSGVVVAIEPSPAYVELIKLKPNVQHFIALHQAVGSTNKTYSLYQDKAHPGDTRYFTTNKHENAEPAGIAFGTTLDALILEHNLPNPDFLYIDTQGNELRILQGATKCLRAKKRKSPIGVMVAFCPPALAKAHPDITNPHRVLFELLIRNGFLMHYVDRDAQKIVPIDDHDDFLSRHPIQAKKRDNLIYLYAEK